MHDSPSPPATPRGRKRRDALLDAAQAMFLEHGYANVGVGDIVARAGGSLATLYKHFGSKERLFQAVMERRARRVFDVIDARNNWDIEPAQALTTMGEHLLGIILCREALDTHRLVVAEASRQPELAELFFDSGPRRLHEALKRYFHHQVEQQRLELEDASDAASMFMGMLLGEHHLRAMLQLPTDNSPSVLRARAERCVRLFLDGANPRRC
ncbi:TetR/AcrR family transcriptional regulator TvrR [Halomonas shantousis]